jgi:hypothetical protein
MSFLSKKQILILISYFFLGGSLLIMRFLMEFTILKPVTTQCEELMLKDRTMNWK